MSIYIKINDFGLKLIEDQAQKYLNDVAEDIKNEAKRIVPVDTGLLRDSIVVKDGIDKNEKLIGTDVRYAMYVEFGTIKHGPQPYLRPALDRIIGAI
jgi:HK97 gp10 family phage protein